MPLSLAGLPVTLAKAVFFLKYLMICWLKLCAGCLFACFVKYSDEKAVVLLGYRLSNVDNYPSFETYGY